MNDRGLIIAGLAVFLVLATFPAWYTLGSTGGASPPHPELPKDGSRCVEDKEYMIANHMQLLIEWREAVVRGGDSSTIEIDGKEYEKSLSKGCMSCHTSRTKFCYECHKYANVQSLRRLQEPTRHRTIEGIRCWGCHVAPEEIE